MELLVALIGALLIDDCCADAVNAGLESSFSCKARPYGFYADPEHGCRIFHICNPQLIDGETVTNQFTYDCPAGEQFDQLRFACVEASATSLEACKQAEYQYGINEAFTLRTAVLASRTSEEAFSCESLVDGSYADVRSGCRSYYVCTRVADVDTAFKMSCPIPTVFDQFTSSCNYPDLARPCEHSERYFRTRPGFTAPWGPRKPSRVVNLSPRGELYLPDLPEDSVYRSPVGNKLLSSEVVLAGLGLRNTIALHAPTASNGRPVSKAPPSNFSCDGRPYGYYADVELECAYFHVCTVKPGADGWRVFVANSFRCEEDHVFDQEQFECRERDEALPCSQAEAYYGGNSVWNE
ncbi:uncharacterized protein LOC144178828 [Haemaphysalis longicornis]